jgi:polar amino acid transport system permease protein
MIWDWAYAGKILPTLAEASLTTLAATVCGFLFAMTLGLVLAVLGSLRTLFVTMPVMTFVEFIRSTPLLIQLFALYYFLPLWGVTLPAFACGVIALGVHYSTYCSEVFRSGLENIPRGQWEAATALNMPLSTAYRRIILPQAIPPVILPLGNYFVAMFKETPVLLAVSIIELVAAAKIIGNDTFRYTEPFTLAGLFFLVFSIAASILVRWINSRMKYTQI